MRPRLLDILAGALAGLVATLSSPALAQLKDEVPAERDAQILRALVPGTYSNGEQVFFDARLNLPAAMRAARLSVQVETARLSGGGEPILQIVQGSNKIIYALKLDRGPLEVRWAAHRMRRESSSANVALSDLEAIPNCDLISRREAGQFRAVATGTCSVGPAELMITEKAIWWRETGSIAFARLNRARQFDCYVDMPGSGGILGETFHRFEGLKVDDQGTEAWFTTKEATPRRLGLRLRAVDWPMNNKIGTYTRDSLTLYLLEQQADGTPRNITYTFTEPDVRRIGLNTIAILANCYMDAPATAKPEF
jgi:hypothetical protein